MNWLQNYVNISFFNAESDNIKNTLEKKWSIPSSEIENIDKPNTSEDYYQIVLSDSFVNEGLVRRFLEYNDKYEMDRDEDKISVYLEGPEGKFIVDDIQLNEKYKLRVSYLEEDIKSDAKLRLDFLSDLDAHRRSGDFKFVDKRSRV